MNAVAMNSGARNTRNLAETVSSSASPGRHGKLRQQSRERQGHGADPGGADGRTPRHEQREADAGVVEKFQGGCPLHQREMPRRVFEEHRLVDHGEFKVCRRVVHWNAGILREQHHGERDGRERQARVKGEILDCEPFRDQRQGRGRGQQRGDENDHQQGRLGEEADHHFPSCTERAERSADVHGRQRHEGTRDCEETHQRDRVGRGTEGQACAHRGNDRCGGNHRAEHDIRRDAEQRRRVLRDHSVLVEQFANTVVREQQARCTPVLQPGTAGVDPAEEQRGEDQCREHFQKLGEPGHRAHSITASSTTRVMKLYVR
jgi:hypothetical protein